MKTYHFPLVPAMAVAALLGTPAIAAPALPEPAPIITNTDHPTLAPIEGTLGQTDSEKPNAASPSGAVKNMAPVRGKPLKGEFIKPGESGSGLTLPGGSNGDGGTSTTPDESDLFSD